MSSLMTSPSSSAPASPWSVNQPKNDSWSSCCRFLPTALSFSFDFPVKSWPSNNRLWLPLKAAIPCQQPWYNHDYASVLCPTTQQLGYCSISTATLDIAFYSNSNCSPTFPAFHSIGVDFDDGSPVSLRWNSFEIVLLAKYGFSSKYWKQNLSFSE